MACVDRGYETKVGGVKIFPVVLGTVYGRGVGDVPVKGKHGSLTTHSERLPANKVVRDIEVFPPSAALYLSSRRRQQ